MNDSKPDFIICGVQKSGTTSLQKYLSQHKNIKFQPPGTEIHFFDNPEKYEKGESEFLKFFEEVKSNRLIAQSTASYIYDYVPERMSKYVPKTKLIFILRNPVDRAYSHFWHANSKYREKLSFEDALKIEHKRISKDYWHLINYSYFSSGLYMKMIENFLKFYKKEQIHIVILEELKNNIVPEINKICNFLEIPVIEKLQSKKAYNQTKISKNKFIGKIFNNKFTRTNKIFYPLYMFHNKFLGKKYPKMKPETRKILLEKYIADIESLEEFLNKDLRFWKQK